MRSTTKTSSIIAVAVSGILLLSATGRAQEGKSGKFDPIRLKTPLRFRPFSTGMTAIDPPGTKATPTESQPKQDQPPPAPSPRRSLIAIEDTAKGTLRRYSDGSTVELKPEVITEKLPSGTKIETLPEGTTILHWPNGSGLIRYPDGTGAQFNPDPREPNRDGDSSPIQGTIELLPGGAVRQTLNDEGVVLDKFPDGRVQSRPDLVKTETR
jgi:hypothetical protein